MTAQNLWQAHYKILSIILLKKFRKLNVNMDMIIKNVKHVELNTKTVVCLCCNKNYQKCLIKT